MGYAQLTWRLLHRRRVEVPGALRERFHLPGMDVHAGDKLGHEAVLAQGFEFGLPYLDRRPAVEHVYFRLLPQRVPWSLAAVSRRAIRFCQSSSLQVFLTASRLLCSTLVFFRISTNGFDAYVRLRARALRAKSAWRQYRCNL